MKLINMLMDKPWIYAIIEVFIPYWIIILILNYCVPFCNNDVLFSKCPQVLASGLLTPCYSNTPFGWKAHTTDARMMIEQQFGHRSGQLSLFWQYYSIRSEGDKIQNCRTCNLSKMDRFKDPWEKEMSM